MNKKILVIGLSGESVFLNLDHFNKPGETIQAIDKKTEPGGKGYNQAIALGKLGCDVTFITALGNDGYSDECIRVLKENNVKPCIVYKNIPGSYAVISVDSKGENNVIVYKGASELITFEDIYNNYKQNLDSAEIILLQLEFNEELTTQLIDYLYEKDKIIVVNPAPRNYLSVETLQKVNILTPNEFELSLLDISKIKATVITTLGNKGAKLEKDNKLFSSYKVKAIDTTGAGDIFNAGLVCQISKGKTIEEAIDFANACSALEVTKKGVVDAIPTYDEVIKFMKG